MPCVDAPMEAIRAEFDGFSVRRDPYVSARFRTNQEGMSFPVVFEPPQDVRRDWQARLAGGLFQQPHCQPPKAACGILVGDQEAKGLVLLSFDSGCDPESSSL